MEKKKDNRGGARAGAGRKRKKKLGLTDPQIDRMLLAAEKVEKETGVSIDEILVRIIYSSQSMIREKLAAIKIFKEYTIMRKSELDINVTQQVGPTIGLPELKPLPDNVVSINNK